MDDADKEDGGVAVSEAEVCGLGKSGVAKPADAPGEIDGTGDEEGDAAAGEGGRVVPAGAVMAEPGDCDVEGEQDEGGADETLADGVHAGGQGEMEGDDGDAEDGDGEGVAEGVEQAEAHAFAPAALDAGDVGDGGEVIVVEAMAQAEQSAGDESQLKRVGHGVGKGTARWEVEASRCGWVVHRMKRTTGVCGRFVEEM